ncbi:MAG: hypothetical protein PHP37_03640, partial [Patescibacteria group bacterium]|nr:hypothetical protein [Patescibacteria group bacterium]
DIKAQAEQATEPDPTPPDDIDIKIETDGEEPNLADDFATESESSEDLSDVDWGDNDDTTDDDEGEDMSEEDETPDSDLDDAPDDEDDDGEASEEVDAMGGKKQKQPSADDSATVEEPLTGFFDPDYFEAADGSPRLWTVMKWNHDQNGQPRLVVIIYGTYTANAPKMEDGDYTFLLEPIDGSSNFDADDLSIIRDRDGYPAFRIADAEPRLSTQHNLTIWEGDKVIYETPITLPSNKKFEAWATQHSKPEPKLFYADEEFVDVDKMKTDPGGKLFAFPLGINGAIIFCPSWRDTVPTGEAAEENVEWVATPLNNAPALTTVPSISNNDGTPCVRVYADSDQVDFVTKCAGKRYLVQAFIGRKELLRAPVRMPVTEKYTNGSGNGGKVVYASDGEKPNVMANAFTQARPQKPRPNSSAKQVEPIRADDEMEMMASDNKVEAEPTKTPAEIAAAKAAEAKKARAAKAAESKKQQDAGENLGELLTESADADPDDDATEPQTKGEQALVKAITNGSSKVVHSSGPEDNDELTESQMVLALNGAVQSSEGDKPKEDEDTDEKLARARKRELEKRDDSSRQPNRGKRSSKRRRH